MNTDNNHDPSLLKAIRDNLKSFALNIKSVPPDQQYMMLKSYIKQVMKDPINDYPSLLFICILGHIKPLQNKTKAQV